MAIIDVNTYGAAITYTKKAVKDIEGFSILYVQELPTTDIKTNALYLVPNGESEESNLCDEYVNSDGTTSGWEKIGSTEVDLSAYATNEDLGKLKTINDVTGSKNMLMYPYYGSTKTSSGITFTDNGDGSITVDGTATANTYFTLWDYWYTDAVLEPNTYILSGLPSDTLDNTIEIQLRHYDVDTRQYTDIAVCDGGDCEFTIDSSITRYNDLRIYVYSGASFDNVIIKPMMRLDIYEDDIWESYALPNQELTKYLFNSTLGLSGYIKDYNTETKTFKLDLKRLPRNFEFFLVYSNGNALYSDSLISINDELTLSPGRKCMNTYAGDKYDNIGFMMSTGLKYMICQRNSSSYDVFYVLPNYMESQNDGRNTLDVSSATHINYNVKNKIKAGLVFNDYRCENIDFGRVGSKFILGNFTYMIADKNYRNGYTAVLVYEPAETIKIPYVQEGGTLSRPNYAFSNLRTKLNSDVLDLIKADMIQLFGGETGLEYLVEMPWQGMSSPPIAEPTGEYMESFTNYSDYVHAVTVPQILGFETHSKFKDEYGTDSKQLEVFRLFSPWQLFTHANAHYKNWKTYPLREISEYADDWCAVLSVKENDIVIDNVTRYVDASWVFRQPISTSLSFLGLIFINPYKLGVPKKY